MIIRNDASCQVFFACLAGSWKLEERSFLKRILQADSRPNLFLTDRKVDIHKELYKKWLGKPQPFFFATPFL